MTCLNLGGNMPSGGVYGKCGRKGVFYDGVGGRFLRNGRITALGGSCGRYPVDVLDRDEYAVGIFKESVLARIFHMNPEGHLASIA